MKAIQAGALSISVLAFLTLVRGAAAQTTSSAVLNSLEVQELIKRAEPADQARLGAHFAALADRSAAEAKQHTSMAQSYVGNPRGNLGTGMSVHCKGLAEMNTESATTLRELAAYHQKLGAGTPATPPIAGGRFQGGAGARAPTNQELSALAAKASTPADHRSLEEYFQALAKRYGTDANDHAAMARAYRGTKIAQSAAHCDRLVALSRDEAKEATAAAEMHKQLAGVAR